MDHQGSTRDAERIADPVSTSEFAPAAFRAAGAAAEQTVVVMFADLVGFSRITAATGSHAAAKLLACALQRQIDIVEAADGEVRNIMGDAIMASWSVAPGGARPMVCARAVRAAFAIAAAMRDLPSPLEARRGLAVRIGVHVGPALLSNVAAGHPGGRTLIGDTVNIAAKLQQARASAAAARIFAVRVSAELYRELPPDQQALLPAHATINVGARMLHVHSGCEFAPRERPAPMRHTSRFNWADCLDRCTDHLAPA